MDCEAVASLVEDRFELASAAYKLQKEAFVTGFSGIDSVVELVLLTLAVPLCMVALSCQPGLPTPLRIVLLVAHMLGSCTSPLRSSLPLLYILDLTLIVFSRAGAPAALSSAPHKPWLSHFRAAAMLSTVVAILAVDYTVFPRHHVKTESRGLALMDLGVGVFVVSSGLSSRGHRASLASLAPLLVLGFGRVLTHRTLEYQAHVSEYGVHWNFFATLAVVSLVGGLLSPARRYFPLLAGVLLAGYEYALHSLGLDSFLLSDTRDNLVSANKEGLASSLGFIALYLLSSYTGSILRAPCSRQGHRLRVLYLVLLDTLLWGVYYTLRYGVLEEPSRRLANTVYVVVVLAFTTLHVAILYGASVWLSTYTGPVVKQVNAHQLVFFLVANLCTGAINLSSQTLYASCTQAMTILTVYCGALLGGITYIPPYFSK